MIDEDGVPTAEAWVANAICGKVDDPDMFFSGQPEIIKEAISMCHQCPVRILCAEYAIKNEITDGIWGGLTEADRRSIRRNKSSSRKGIPNRKH